ncbi:MAG: ubiquinol-cytochrome c reductase iron-sulfur subunit [Betaproteobacteria bacterium]|nr:ubiquinol-cytochrome c reductase iron-sulfur subunit [Betaproteobacteria bacterium]
MDRLSSRDAMTAQPLLPANAGRRRFLTLATALLGAVGTAYVIVPLVESLEPDASVKAAAATTVALSPIEPGMQVTVPWQSKPLIVVHRTPEMLATLQAVETLLRDPNCEVPQQPPECKNRFRSLKPQWLVMVRVCTHLCCTPLYEPRKGSVGPRWLGGFHCPCHGSLYDLSGRVFKGVPAPRNMAIPLYHFSEDEKQVAVTAMYPESKLC